MTDYQSTLCALREISKHIKIDFNREGDGRLESAVLEREYLDLLERLLLERYPNFTFTQAKARHWYDFMVNQIPFNLKLSKGDTADNAFNKVAAIYSITGQDPKSHSMNFNKFWDRIKNDINRTDRIKEKEYHYFVVDKSNGDTLIKSLFDIKTYKSNPSNTMQINWRNEFQNIEYQTSDFVEKKKELIRTIQISERNRAHASENFRNAEI